jgi:WD40 repeat protein
LISGAGKVSSGVPYALNLTTDEAITQWTINWGDGNVQTISGNPSSVSHTYTGGTASRSISATALRSDATTATASVATPGQFTDTFVSANSGGLQDDRYMVFGPDGNLYVSDAGSNDILRYSGSTGAPLPSAGNTGAVFIQPGSGGLTGPQGLRFGPDGNLYVCSYSTLNDGSIVEYDGASGSYLRTFVSPGSAGANFNPRDLTWGPDGNVYVTDWNAYYVRRFNGSTGAFMDVFATDPTGAAYLTGLAFGPDHNLYVSDWNAGGVLRFNGATGAYIDDVVPPGYGGPHQAWGLAFGPDGDLYVAGRNSDTVFAYDLGTGNLLGTRTTGTSLAEVWDVAFGPDNNLYVAAGGLNFSVIPATISRFTGPFMATTDTQLPVTVLGTTTYTNSTSQTLSSKGTTVTSTINVPTGGTIFDLSVKLNIKAGNDHYLTATLTSPAGTKVQLIAARELSGSNLTNTVLQDSARAFLGEGTAPYTGAFHTSGNDDTGAAIPLLASLAGQNPAGTWTLQVTYKPGNGPNGQLVNWSLTIARDANALQAASAPASPVMQAVTPGQLQPLVAAAEQRWEEAGVDPARLAGVQVQVTDLGGTTLGLQSGNSILIDDNAAGWGWFVDATPHDDSEFTTPGNQGEQNHMDLLTVLMHEMGHVLGLDHDGDGVMQETLTPGTRRLPTADEVAEVGSTAPAASVPSGASGVAAPAVLATGVRDAFFTGLAKLAPDWDVSLAIALLLDPAHKA